MGAEARRSRLPASPALAAASGNPKHWARPNGGKRGQRQARHSRSAGAQGSTGVGPLQDEDRRASAKRALLNAGTATVVSTRRAGGG